MTETLLQDVFSQDYNRLCVIAYRILQDKSLAQDAVQESWLRLCKLKSLDTSDREKVKHLLVLVVRHTAFNMNQRKHPESMEDSAITLLPDNAEMPHEALERREKVQLLLSVLQRLDEIDQTILRLQYGQELTSKQIAVALGIQPASVRQHAHRARLALRNILEQEGITI